MAMPEQWLVLSETKYDALSPLAFVIVGRHGSNN